MWEFIVLDLVLDLVRVQRVAESPQDPLDRQKHCKPSLDRRNCKSRTGSTISVFQTSGALRGHFRTLATNRASPETSVNQFLQVKLTGARGHESSFSLTRQAQTNHYDRRTPRARELSASRRRLRRRCFPPCGCGGARALHTQCVDDGAARALVVAGPPQAHQRIQRMSVVSCWNSTP